MGVLTVLPKPEIFSKVPLLEDAYSDFLSKNASELIKSVGEIFVKHDAFNDFGLSMVHRHFNLSPKDEILVETIDDKLTKSVAVPWIINGSSAKPVLEETWTSNGLPERKYIIPMSWFFNSEGELLPFEYIAVDEKSHIDCLPTEEFTSELYNALRQLGIEHLIGIRRITSVKDIDTWETTPDGIRANVTAFGKKPDALKDESMIQVIWSFNEYGRVRGEGGWCLVCTGNTKTCTHKRLEA